jgi:signal transduction histidine kinase
MSDASKSTSKPRGFFRGLSAKVLALTILFVLLGEVFIFLPSIANFRIQWMKTRIAQAEIAALAAEASPDANLNEALRTEILKGAGVVAVSLKRGEARQLMLRNTEDVVVDQTYDLRSGRYWSTLPEAMMAFARNHDRVISVIDIPPNMSGELIDVSLHEGPLSKAMRSYALNILFLSIILSLIVATMIYAALNRVLVRPMQRLSSNMTAFGDKPEDASRIIAPSTRFDEIGTAEHELHDMQTQLQGLLQQKNRLAAVGLAVSKVSHDLRNMLTTAQVVSDSMASVKDPHVQKFAPRLITSLDRAISFLTQTLKYGQAQEPPPQRVKLNLHELAEDVLSGFEFMGQGRFEFSNSIPTHVIVDADREQLHRILTNLVRNAIQAFDTEAPGMIGLQAQRNAGVTDIEVEDNGPGIPAAVRERLFEAFQTAAKPGGTGLGLAISNELALAHGGSIHVKRSSETGTCFVVSIPDQGIAFKTEKH